MITSLGIKIIGLGIAIPMTITVLVSIITSVRKSETAGTSYRPDRVKLFLAYLFSLLGWVIVFGMKV